MTQINVNGMIEALQTKGETRLSNHIVTKLYRVKVLVNGKWQDYGDEFNEDEIDTTTSYLNKQGRDYKVRCVGDETRVVLTANPRGFFKNIQ